MKINVNQESKTEKVEIENFTRAHEEAKTRLERWQNFCEADPDGARDYYKSREYENEQD